MRYLALFVALFSCATTEPTNSIGNPYSVSVAQVPEIFKLGDVDGQAASDFSDFIAASAGKKEIHITIDSGGGSVAAGQQIIKEMEAFPGAVVCTVEGMAASMAAAILGSCDYRIMTKRSMLMFHEPAMMVHGQPAEVQQDVDFLRVLTLALNEQYTLKSKITAEEVGMKIAGGYEWWMSWKEAQEFGFVDEVMKK